MVCYFHPCQLIFLKLLAVSTVLFIRVHCFLSFFFGWLKCGGYHRGWLTKSSPEFYDPILEHDSVRGTGMGHGDLWLLDDSAVNLEVSIFYHG